MYAVIKTGGKQYRVQAGDVLVVEKLAGEPGANLTFSDVLMIGAFTGFYLGPKVLQVVGGGPGFLAMSIVLVLAMATCAVVGIVIEKLCYRPLRERPRTLV